MLVQHGIQVENLGGDVQAVSISALKKINLKQLTEALVTQAELLEIGGDPSGPIEATVIESRIDPHKGRLSTVIVHRGTLKTGQILVADTVFAKVRILRDAQGKVLKEVGPGRPAEVEGWRDLPSAGDQVLQVDSEKHARMVIKYREEKKNLEKQAKDADAIKAKVEKHEEEYKKQLMLKRSLGRFKVRKQGPRKPEIIEDDNGIPRLNLILKTDVDGTLEAILETLTTYNSTECEMDIINFGVGAVTENDVELAHAFKGTIDAFRFVFEN